MKKKSSQGLLVEREALIPLGEGRTPRSEEKRSSKTIVLFPKVKLNFSVLQEIMIVIE